MLSSISKHLGRCALPGRRQSGPSADDYRLLQQIREAARGLRELTDAQNVERTASLQQSIQDGDRKAASDHVICEGFALVNESVRRCLGWEYYDVQLLGALALVRGTIAEMATGEGKTLVQALVAFVLALPGKGVHVMTPNAYLAKRDFQQLGSTLQRLGLTVGFIETRGSPAEKRQAYLADITYGAGYEFGFDYLRDEADRAEASRPMVGDSLRRRLRDEQAAESQDVQRGHAVAIVDEADSVMIDEATRPLLLSANPVSPLEAAPVYLHAAEVAATLKAPADYVIEDRKRCIRLTPNGLASILRDEVAPRCGSLERPWPIYIEQALAARQFLCRDVDYVVDEDRIVLVDQATGRVFVDRSLRDGLHQALEAKERVPVTATRRIRARISRQQFMLRYDVLCGMTGTALDAEREFREIYCRRVMPISTRERCRRLVLRTRFFASKSAKRTAVIAGICDRHATGQPILVGTRTIEESICLAELLRDAGLDAQLLNGRQDLDEAEVVSRAGEFGAITIATNIAGRGTDISLGERTEALGGLHVIATEPHASTRIDRQLLGRAARRGEPGSCQMFVSAEDDVVRVFGSRLARTLRRLAGADGEVHDDFSRELARLQARVERLNFEKRSQLRRHEAWLEDVLARLTGNQSSSDRN